MDEKADKASTDGEDKFEVPQGMPSYQEYLKSLGYNLFTCGVEPEDANDVSEGANNGSSSSSSAGSAGSGDS